MSKLNAIFRITTKIKIALFKNIRIRWWEGEQKNVFLWFGHGYSINEDIAPAVTCTISIKVQASQYSYGIKGYDLHISPLT